MKELQSSIILMNAELTGGMLEPGSEFHRPAASDQQPAARTPHPAPRNPYLAPRNPQPVTRNSIFLFLSLLFLSFVFPGTGTFASQLDQKQAAFKETVYRLSSFADRSTGTAGNQAAAAYIKERLERLGFETVGTHKFAVLSSGTKRVP